MKIINNIFIVLNIVMILFNIWFFKITFNSYFFIKDKRIEKLDLIQERKTWVDEYAPLITPETAP